MTTTSKNHAAILVLALSKLVPDGEVQEFCFSHSLDIAECYLNATEIVSPGKLLKALEEAEQEILEKQAQGIQILTIFDYGDQVDKSYLYFTGDENCIFAKKFTVNISKASNILAMRVEEALESIARRAPEDLAMVGGANSSFASSVRYHECNRPVIMMAEALNNFKNNFADCMVYDVRPSELYSVPVTFELITQKGESQMVADVNGHTVNMTKLGLNRATEKIVRLIEEAQASGGEV